MEDHRDAYFLWKQAGLTNQLCIHVDAHLDVCDLKTPAYEGLEYPHINCGNFLLPAMDEGLISSLIWVIPEHLPQGEPLLNWSQLELQNWVHVELADYMSLELREGRVHGTLRGKPFVICYSKNLPPVERPVVLDIDVDYYLCPGDGLWQEPLALHSHLKELDINALTVAYSVDGGYTPIRHRAQGPLTILAWANPDGAKEIWQRLQDPEQQATENDPDWLKAAFFWRQGEHDRAIALDPSYEAQAIDQLSAAMMRQKFTEAREHLANVPKSSEADFMDGMISYREKKYQDACDVWTQLLDTTELPPQTQVYLLTLLGRGQCELKDHNRAFETFERASELSRRDSELTYLKARCCAATDQLERAARLYRKAMKYAPGRLETAEIRLELAEVHLALGQLGLANRLLSHTLKGRVPGFMKLRAEALKLKSALSKQKKK